MADKPLQLIGSRDLRQPRLLDGFAFGNWPVRICGALAQHPQLVGSSGRQGLDHVELRLQVHANGERLWVRWARFECRAVLYLRKQVAGYVFLPTVGHLSPPSSCDDRVQYNQWAMENGSSANAALIVLSLGTASRIFSIVQKAP
ncbi:MAG TPA: hypothetical protein VFS91_11490 [Nitrobacter sp.]|nr:hypothetical protein [Nitrobacter sp.]